MWQRVLRLINLPEHWRIIDRESIKPAQTDTDWQTIIVLLVVTCAIIFSMYAQTLFADPAVQDGHYANLPQLASWVTAIVIGYIGLPVIAVMFLPGESLREYYLSTKGLWKKLPWYLLLSLLFLPVIWLASVSEAFQASYPFYVYLHRSAVDFFAWEILYLLHFVAVEFMFRGFMLRGLSHSFGSKAIFIMLVPYTLVHIGKPLAEVIGAMLAAIILGTLAMRTRMIWGGVIIHVLIALMMDIFAMQYCMVGLPCR